MAAILSSSTHCGKERKEWLLRRFSGIIHKSQKVLELNAGIISSPYSTISQCSKTRKANVASKKYVTDGILVKRDGLVEREKKELVRKAGRVSPYSTSQCLKIQKSTDHVVSKKCFTDGIQVRRDELVERKKKELERKAEIQKLREAARRKIDAMHNDSGICDPQQVMRDFEELIGYNENKVTNRASLSAYEYASMSNCFMKIDCCTVPKVEEAEEGEILD